jgi:hypothetical protein
MAPSLVFINHIIPAGMGFVDHTGAIAVVGADVP